MQGCDASVMLVAPNGNDERHNSIDLSLAGDGFDMVIKAKAAVDSNHRCRNRVSCADILAMATRDVVSMVLDRYSNQLIKTQAIMYAVFSSSANN